DDLVTDHLVCKAERPVELAHDRRFGLGLNDHVVALPAMIELVGETTLAPSVDPAGVAPPGADQLGGTVDRGPDRVLLQAGVEDDHDFIGPHGRAHLPPDPGRHPGLRPRSRSRVESDGLMVVDTGEKPSRPWHGPEDARGV